MKRCEQTLLWLVRSWPDKVSANLPNLALSVFVLGAFHSQTELEFVSHQLWLCKRAHRNVQGEVYYTVATCLKLKVDKSIF